MHNVSGLQSRDEAENMVRMMIQGNCDRRSLRADVMLYVLVLHETKLFKSPHRLNENKKVLNDNAQRDKLEWEEHSPRLCEAVAGKNIMYFK